MDTTGHKDALTYWRQEVITMSQKTRLSITYGLSLLAASAAINNSLLCSLIPLMRGMYLIRDLLVKKRHADCLIAVVITAVINTLIFVLGYNRFYEIGLPFLINTGIMIIFNSAYTYALMQANNRQLPKVIFINTVSYLSLAFMVILSDLVIKMLLHDATVGVLNGFWLMLLMMGLVNLSSIIVLNVRKVNRHHSALKRKLS